MNPADTAIRQTKCIWRQEEDVALLNLCEERGTRNWAELARLLQVYQGMEKTAKQCRERYRNYLNPSLQRRCWDGQEKLLFTLLHTIYGNQWNQIARCLNNRSDLCLKNLFYSTMRKTVRYVNASAVHASLLSKPAKFIQLCLTLELIKAEYLPNDRTQQRPAKEKVLLELMARHKFTKELIERYQEHLTKGFADFHGSDDLPLAIILDLSAFALIGDDMVAYLEGYHKLPLSRLVTIHASREGAVPNAPLQEVRDSVIKRCDPITANAFNPFQLFPQLYPWTSLAFPHNYYCWATTTYPCPYPQPSWAFSPGVQTLVTSSASGEQLGLGTTRLSGSTWTTQCP